MKTVVLILVAVAMVIAACALGFAASLEGAGLEKPITAEGIIQAKLTAIDLIVGKCDTEPNVVIASKIRRIDRQIKRASPAMAVYLTTVKTCWETDGQRQLSVYKTQLTAAKAPIQSK